MYNESVFMLFCNVDTIIFIRANRNGEPRANCGKFGLVRFYCCVSIVWAIKTRILAEK